MGKSNVELLKIAQKHLGEGGSKFRKFCGLPAGAPWCNAFVDYIANEGGDASLFFDGKRPTYCPTSIKWCNKNLALVPLYMALPMDIIYFDWEKNGVPNHIGYVRAKKSTSEILTIEGNTDKKDKNGKTISHNVVAERSRAGKYVQGVYRPHFPGKYTLQKLKVDGEFGYDSIANLQKALNINIDAILGQGTVKALQKRAGLTGKSIDGAFGPATARAVQKLVGAKPVDGQFGPNSVRKLQEWINNINYPSTNKKPAETKPAPPASIPVENKTSTYPGTFPSIPAGKIIECTRSVNGMRKHKLLSGDYILRFKSEERRYKMCKFSMATVSNKKISYSNYPKFEDKVKAFGYNLPKVRALKTSANCSNFIDGAVGAVTGKYVRDLGAKHNKKYLAKTNFFTSHKYSKGAILAGDICGTSKHTWMIIQGAGLSIGCEGTNVKRMQSFLNWAGYNCGNPDGDFGTKTLAAVKAFQKANGLAVDGVFGPASINKAKTIRR